MVDFRRIRIGMRCEVQLASGSWAPGTVVQRYHPTGPYVVDVAWSDGTVTPGLFKAEDVRGRKGRRHTEARRQC